MKKKILAIALSVSVLAVIAAGITLAYFSDTQTKNNVFTVGNVKLDITEPNAEERDDIYPYEKVLKDPTIKNIGNNPCFVRVKVDIPLIPGTTTPYAKIEGNLGEKWVDGKDGFYYYQGVVESQDKDVSAKIAPVFEAVRFSKDITGNEVTTGELSINIIAYAIQAQGLISGSYSDVEDGISDAELAKIAIKFKEAFPNT